VLKILKYLNMYEPTWIEKSPVVNRLPELSRESADASPWTGATTASY
jgi:hypothetical protein